MITDVDNLPTDQEDTELFKGCLIIEGPDIFIEDNEARIKKWNELKIGWDRLNEP
jgi:hypothetical protein